MLIFARRALALLLAASIGLTGGPAPVSARMLFESVGLVPGLPAGTANSDGSLSIPAGGAPAGSSVGFYVEGTLVGTATAAANGSATLTKPLFPPAAGAAFQYGAQKTSAATVAPGSPIPAYNVYNQFIPNANDTAGWTVTSGATLTKVDATSLQLQTTATGTTLQYLSEYITSLPAGQYTLGVTGVMTAGDPTTTSLGLRFFDPQYATNAANPTIALNTPVRVSMTFTVSGNRNQSIAVVGNKLDNSTSAATFKLYNFTLSAGKIDPFAPATDGSLAAPQLVPLTAPSIDYTSQNNLKPVYPTDPVFTKADAKPAFGNLLPGATNVMHYDFTKATGNIRDRKTLEKHFFLSSVNPGYPPNTRNAVTPNNSYDGVDGAIGYARMRNYPEGHPYNLHKFKDAGLYLDVIGYQNDKQSYLYPQSGTDATTYAGYVRSQTIYRPGMVFEVKAQYPSDMEGWGPTWLLGFTQISPGRVPASNGDPMFGYQTNADGTTPPGFTAGPVQTDAGNTFQLFYQLSHKGKVVYGEFDSPDMWNDTSNNPAYKGRTMSAGIVNGAVSVDEVDTAYHSFFANSGDYTYVFPKPYTYKTGGTTIDSTVHTFTFNWRNDGSNMVDFLCDGVVYLQGYKEYYAGQFYNILTKRLEQLGMMDMIGGQFGRGFASRAPYTPDGGTKGLLMVSMDAWIGNLDLSSVTIPANGLSNYPAVTLDTLSAVANSAWTATIGNGRSAETRIRATSSDGTVLTVTGTGATRTVTGTFTTAGSKTISIREIPYAVGEIARGVPTTTTFTVNVSATAALNNLLLSPTTTNIGSEYAGTLSPTTSGSTVTAASGDSTPMTITGTGTSRTAKGTFTTAGVANITPTEVYSGTTKVSPATALTVVADNPAGANLLTDQVIGGSMWTIGAAGGNPSVTVTPNSADVAGGATGQLVVPTTASGLHRFSRTFGGLTTGGLYETYVIVKRSGTGNGSKYLLIGNSNAWGKAVCDLQPAFPTCKLDSTYTPSGGYFVTPLANGFYKIGVRANIPAGTTAQTIFVEMVNGYNTDDTVSGVGIFTGDGTSGLIFSSTYFGAP
jgi:hypothetical protein